MDKMFIYNNSKAVPQEAQKPIVGGRLKGMTDINPMWRIKKLTEMFGPAGIGWKFETPVFEEKNGAGGEVMVFCSTALRIKADEKADWSDPIPGIGGAMLVTTERSGQRTDDDAYKKAYTDAQSVACKALGVGASIYWENDPSKYDPGLICADCGSQIIRVDNKDGSTKFTALEVARKTKEKYGCPLCWNCSIKRSKKEKEDGGMTHA